MDMLSRTRSRMLILMDSKSLRPRAPVRASAERSAQQSSPELAPPSVQRLALRLVRASRTYV